MSVVRVTMFVREQGPTEGWTYTGWTIDWGTGMPPLEEEVRVWCAESRAHYMSREDAVQEAKRRIRCKIYEQCGDAPEPQITWRVESLPA